MLYNEQKYSMIIEHVGREERKIEMLFWMRAVLCAGKKKKADERQEIVIETRYNLKR